MIGHKNILDVSVGDRHVVNTSVLFSGVREFSSFINEMNQAKAFEWLVMFTGIMTPIVQNRRGLVEKYLGDGLMALNKNPNWALYTAMEMQRALDRINDDKDIQQKYLSNRVMQMGISIHSGLVCAGLIGDGKKLSPCTISNVVNLAARFERLTKYYGLRLLISSVAAKHMRCLDRYAHRSIGRVRVKGSTEVYELLDVYHTDPDRDVTFKTTSLANFQAGLAAYSGRDFETAAAYFRKDLPPTALFSAEVSIVASSGQRHQPHTHTGKLLQGTSGETVFLSEIHDPRRTHPELGR